MKRPTDFHFNYHKHRQVEYNPISIFISIHQIFQFRLTYLDMMTPSPSHVELLFLQIFHADSAPLRNDNNDTQVKSCQSDLVNKIEPVQLSSDLIIYIFSSRCQHLSIKQEDYSAFLFLIFFVQVKTF